MHTDLDVFKKSWYLFLSKLLRNTNQKNILEIGCGGGEFSYWLSHLNNTVIGTDIVGTGIQITRRKYSSNINISFFLNDAQLLSFKSNCFDIVVIAEVLEHISIPFYTLKEIRRVLKSKGILLITVPNFLSIRLILKCSIGKLISRFFHKQIFIKQPIDHKFYYLSLRNLIHKSGFHILNVFGDDFLAPFYNTIKARENKFLNRLYMSWEKSRILKYFGRSLIIIATKNNFYYLK